ncbi:MAG: hypothetical protein P4L83_07065 [Nevskia sp.]|nr:hypothetical protein [Nevskia sp.]
MQSLTCPYCAQPVDVSGVPLVEGEAVRCAHCGESAVLNREWLGHSGAYQWELVEAGDDDEP